MLGISGPEFLVIILVAVIVVGPQRLPEYTRKLTQAVRRLRVFLDDAKEQIAEEVGPELTDLDLSDLDPRNYDPRKIVRDALGEDLDAIRKDLATPFQSVAKTAEETADGIVRTGSTKSLTRMIDDKAEQTRRARKESAEQDAAETEAQGPAEAAAGSEAEAAASPAEDGAREAVAPDADAATADDEEPDAPSSSEAGPDAAPEEPEPVAPEPVPSSLVEESTSEAAPRVRPISPREIVRAANAAARTRAEAAAAVVDG
ncbi:twin-arginine translocase TatA/TatE family subunit [Actinomyces israelii]|uniref:twin-arginine translocase TatA/TatE family subunit n=1 Tax=Actinomyces israelii TaxID=1659 RepID=UPI0023568C7F|nr:twin-arginine translocase TatA/TatE family subunit [Actinomyces israelii]